MTGRLAIVALLLAGCGPEITWQGGTGVGNPGSARATTAGGRDLVVLEAWLDLDAWRLLRCDGTSERIDVGAELDLLAPPPTELSSLQACGVEAVPAGPMVLSGIAGNGSEMSKGTFEVILDLEPVRLDIDPLLIDGTALILELGYPGWLDASNLGLEDGTHTVVDADLTPVLHDSLSLLVEEGSALFVDADASGAIESIERSDPLATGPLHGTEPDDDR